MGDVDLFVDLQELNDFFFFIVKKIIENCHVQKK